MNRCWRVVFVLAAGLWPVAAPAAGGTLRVTVDEAVALALEANYDVREARERLAENEGRIQEARSEVLPHLSLQADYSRSYDESILDTLEGFIAPEQRDRYGVRASVNQLLFSWGKATGGIEAARLAKIRAEYDLAAARRQVKLAVHQAFYDLLLRQRLVEVARERLDQRQRQLDVAAKRFDAGVVNELEVVRARVDVANARPAVSRAENRVRQAVTRLNNLLARDQGAPLEARGELRYSAEPAPDLDEVVQRALARRPEMASLRQAREIADKELGIARAENKLNVYLQGEYGYATQEFQNLGPDREVWVAGVRFDWPLFDGGRTRGRVAQTASRARAVDIALQRLAQSVALEAKVALDDLREAEEVLAASSLNIEQARKALDLAETSYRYGVATALDVTNAQFGLTTALVNHAQSTHDAVLARARLLAVMDDL